MPSLELFGHVRYRCMQNIECLSVFVKELWSAFKLVIRPAYVTLKDDLHLGTLLVEMFGFERYTCMPNIKCFSVLVQKLLAILKSVISPIYLT